MTFFIDPYKFGSSPAPDPYYADTNLLFHMDSGVGTVLIDNSAFASNGATGSGNVTTSDFEFPPGSLYCAGVSWAGACSPGVAPYTRFDLNGGDWTWEMFFYQVTGSAGSLCSMRGGGPAGWVMGADRIRANINGAWSDAQMTWAAPAADVWHYIVWQKTGTTLDVYLDGALVATKTGVTNIMNDGAGSNFIIGAASNSGEAPFNGLIDEMRFTRGVARYSGSTIDVPIAPFPNF